MTSLSSWIHAGTCWANLECTACPPPPADERAEENQPRNILEEIVWHKGVEIARWRCGRGMGWTVHLLRLFVCRRPSSLCSSPACPGSLPAQCSTQIGCHAPCQQARTCNNILVTLNMTACRLGCLICVRRERVPLGMVMTAAKASPAPRDFIGAIQAAAERTAKPGLIAEVGRQ